MRLTKRMPEFYVKVLSAVIAACLLGCGSGHHKDERFISLKIYHTNDIHSRLRPNNLNQGGLAYLASVLKVIRKQEPEALIIDAGDFYKKGSLPSVKTGDQVTADILSHMPYYDVRAVGNNEIKVGIPKLLEWSKDKEPAPLLSANFVDKDQKPVFLPYIILQKAGLRVGIIGLTHQWNLEKEHQPLEKDKDPRAPYQLISSDEAATPLIKNLRPQVDVLIVVAHQELALSQKLAKKYPEVDLIVSGHTHRLTGDKKVSKENLVVEAGQYGEQIGAVNLVYDKETKKVSSLESVFWPIKSDVQLADPDILKRIDEAYKNHGDGASEKLGEAKNTFTVIDWNHLFEAGFHNFVADVFRQTAKADVALVNRQMIRDSIYMGPIIKEQLLMALPYRDEFVTVNVSKDKFQSMVSDSIQDTFKDDGMMAFGFSGLIVSAEHDKKTKTLKNINMILPEKAQLKVSLPAYVPSHCAEFFKAKYCPLGKPTVVGPTQETVEKYISQQKVIESPALSRVTINSALATSNQTPQSP